METPKYTKEEQEFIDHCFNSTLHIFVKNPLNRDNIEDLREAINYRNYNIGTIGKKNHELMHSIFDKMGYCKDGRTTKTEEHKRQVALEQEKVELWARKKKSAIIDINEKIKELNLMKQEILDHDVNFVKVVEEKAKIVQEQFKEDIKKEQMESQSMLIQQTQETLKTMDYPKLRELAKNKGIPEFYKMKKEELISAIEGS